MPVPPQNSPVSVASLKSILHQPFTEQQQQPSEAAAVHSLVGSVDNVEHCLLFIRCCDEPLFVRGGTMILVSPADGNRRAEYILTCGECQWVAS